MRIERESHTLSNGLRVLLLHRPRLPILSLTLMVRAGVVTEDPTLPGLVHLTTSLFPQGTVRRNAVELAEAVDSLGAGLGVHADYDYLSLGLSSLAGDFDTAIDILAEVVVQPAFAEDELVRKRSDVLALLKRREDDPGYLVRRRFLERLYGVHPYARPLLGTEESIGRSTVGDIRAFYTSQIRPERSVLAVVGQIETARTLDALERAFVAWSPGATPPPSVPDVPTEAAPRFERIQKDGVTQASLRVGGLGISRRHDDYVPAALLNYVVGGSGFGSRLMRTLREEQGLTYGASSGFQARARGGAFIAGCQTSLETMQRALDELLRLIDEVGRDGITEAELDWAKRYFTGSLPLTLQTNDQLAMHLLEMELYDLPDEFWMREIEEMRATSLARVNDVARRYMVAESFLIVALADFGGHSLGDPRQARAGVSS